MLILALFAMFFGYNLRLDARTVKLEKKNGHELEQIKQLTTKINHLEHQLNEMSALPKKKRLTPH